MAYALLDDKFHSNPKILEVGNDGAGLYSRALSYCGDHLTDGFVPAGWARSAGTARQRQKLVDARLWIEVAGGYRIPDFLDLNPSKEKVLAKREAQRRGGKRGAQARWGDSSTNGSTHDSTQEGSQRGTHDDLHGPQPQPLSVTQSSTRDAGADGLSRERIGEGLNSELHAMRLVSAMRDGRPHRDERTVATVTAYASRLAPADFESVREEMLEKRATIKSDARWAVDQLKRRVAARTETAV